MCTVKGWIFVCMVRGWEGLFVYGEKVGRDVLGTMWMVRGWVGCGWFGCR